MNKRIENLTEIISSYKKGNKIHIKKANCGKFTDYCGGKVTSECIARGKASPNPAIRKRATFAANARKGKHAEGGIIEGEETKKYEPTIDDLVKFISSFEGYRDRPDISKTLSGKDQVLAGIGSANPEIIRLAENGQLTREIAEKEVRNQLAKIDNGLNRLIPKFNTLPSGVKLGLFDTVFNSGSPESFVKKSPKLVEAITRYDGSQESLNAIVAQMDHSKNAGGGLGVRSSARRAMALGKYDGNGKTVDKYGRQVDYNQYKGPQDGKSSPYYQKYAKGGGLVYEPFTEKSKSESTKSNSLVYDPFITNSSKKDELETLRNFIFNDYKPAFEVTPVQMPEISQKVEEPIVEESVSDNKTDNKTDEKQTNISVSNNTPEKEKRRFATNYLQEKLGLTKEQASAIVGSGKVESGFNLFAENKDEKAGKNSSVKSNQYGIGIGQGTHDRHDDFVRYINAHGGDKSLQNQLDFAIEEIETKYQDFLNNLRNCDNIQDAVAYTYVQYIGGNAKNIKDKKDLYERVEKTVRNYKAKHKELYGKSSSNNFEIRLKAAIDNLNV